MSNQFAIMRFAKYKGPEISRIEGHNERTKETYASKTLHEIQMVLEGAVEDGLITRNPAKSKRLRNPSTKKNERQALTEEQVGDIISHLPDLKQKRDQRYLALLIYTGMRREEVLGLRW